MKSVDATLTINVDVEDDATEEEMQNDARGVMLDLLSQGGEVDIDDQTAFEAEYTRMACPVCKSGEHLIMRSTSTLAVDQVWRNKKMDHAYIEHAADEQPDTQTDVMWVSCNNCSWNNSPNGEDPWAELVEASP
jgi:hypothetical protein